MATLKRRGSRRIVLDMGSSAIRLCELTPTKAGFQLTRYIQREIPVEPDMDDDTKRSVRVNTLKELLKEAKINPRGKKVVFAMAGQSVFTRTRALPPVPEHKLTQIVQYEIRQQIPFSLDQIALDFQVLNRTDAGGYEVLMAAIKVDVVDKQLSILREVIKGVDTVDVGPLSAYNWLKHNGQFGAAEECVALLDLGASTTDIVIEREGQFRFTRSINVGGNDVTRAISSEFGLPWVEAEKVKRQRGFAPTGDAQRDGKGGEVIGRVLGRLVAEVNRSFAYFRTQPGGGPVSRIVVTGGGVCLRNMIPYLQRQLGVEVRIAHPQEGLTIGPGAQQVNENPEQAAVALGLALRSAGNAAIEINLIPPRILETARRREQAIYWSLIGVTAILILASIIPVQYNKNKLVQQDISMYVAQLRAFDERLSAQVNIRPAGAPPPLTSDYEMRLITARQLVDKFKEQVDFLDRARQTRPNWVRFLVALNRARPIGVNRLVWISAIETASVGEATIEVDTGGDGDIGSRRESRAASRPDPMALGYESAPFPGIKPRIIIEGGARASRSREVETPAIERALPPPNPNSLRVIGYSVTPDGVVTFKDRLEEHQVFLKDGVYFQPRLMTRVPVEEMDRAETGEVVVASDTSQGGGSDDFEDRREDRRMFEGLRSGGGSSNPQALWENVTAQQVTRFQFDVQFWGQPVAKTALEAANSAAAAQGDLGVLGAGDGLKNLFGRGSD